jgi:hypothetical protein
MPAKSKKAAAKEANPQKPAEDKAALEPAQNEGKQTHRAGKPANPFLVRHPPPRLGRPVK